MVTFNAWNLNTINQLPELTTSAAEHNIDFICVKERRYYYSELELKYYDNSNRWAFVLASAWENSDNAVMGVVGMLLSPHALKSLNSMEKT